MNISKAIMLSQGEQAMEDRKLVENANLHEMEVTPTLRIIGSLRYFQALCNEKKLTIQDVTPEIIIDELKNQANFSFQ